MEGGGGHEKNKGGGGPLGNDGESERKETGEESRAEEERVVSGFQSERGGKNGEMEKVSRFPRL